MKNTAIYVSVEKDMSKRLDAIAADKGLKKSQVIRDLLEAQLQGADLLKRQDDLLVKRMNTVIETFHKISTLQGEKTHKQVQEEFQKFVKLVQENGHD